MIFGPFRLFLFKKYAHKAIDANCISRNSTYYRNEDADGNNVEGEY